MITTRLNPKFDVTQPHPNYDIWLETRPDNDMSKVLVVTDGSDETCLYNLADYEHYVDYVLEHKAVTKSISEVRLHMRGKIDHNPSFGLFGAYGFFIIDGVMTEVGSEAYVMFGTTPTTGYYAMSVNPNTNLPWTPQDIQTMKLRVAMNASAPGADSIPVWVYEVWIEVDFEEHPGPALLHVQGNPPGFE